MPDEVMRRIMDRESERDMMRRDRRDYDDERDYRRDYDDCDYRRSRDYDDRARGRIDYEYDRNYEDMRSYEDGRRGVRGSGRGRDRDDMESKPRYLTKSEMHRWKSMLKNVDGSHGEHFDMSQCMNVANKLGISFKEFTEKEFCMAMNMMYSDYCKTVRKYVPEEKHMMFYGDLALDWLEDPDGPEASEKLAKYFRKVVDSE